MAVRGGKALVVAMLISLLLVQGGLGEFRCCHCRVYRKCMNNPRRKPTEEGYNYCILKSFKDCRAAFKHGCPKSGCKQRADPDMGAAFAAAAGGRNHSERKQLHESSTAGGSGWYVGLEDKKYSAAAQAENI
ncbi:hypothetical protein CFC21_036163 [Triticum aestivum]|uniref:Uncharacterized protein n=3 Tax=Triticum TaxID=4564 RepID=A0A3B6EIB3_WHEAT|nr:uncharacterized protein LOC119271997 [Triticum dicoccoides]XP_044337213.1 uncharacterized protein LOC123058565 [Triticum aestivum]KAF7023698.1 hypothetical protein CFC21_036163 [Triticum aestivum]QCX08912.1 jekyll 2 [Triticum turgidum subsp. dicoccum]